MPDTVKKQVQQLYAQLKASREKTQLTTFGALVPSAHEADGAAAVKVLRLAYDRLDDAFQALVSAGQIAKARRVKGVMDEIAAVSISINRAVIDYLDGADDIEAATERVKEAGENLENAAKQLTESVQNLGTISAALDVLTEIVDL